MTTEGRYEAVAINGSAPGSAGIVSPVVHDRTTGEIGFWSPAADSPAITRSALLSDLDRLGNDGAVIRLRFGVEIPRDTVALYVRDAVRNELRRQPSQAGTAFHATCQPDLWVTFGLPNAVEAIRDRWFDGLFLLAEASLRARLWTRALELVWMCRHCASAGRRYDAYVLQGALYLLQAQEPAPQTTDQRPPERLSRLTIYDLRLLEQQTGIRYLAPLFRRACERKAVDLTGSVASSHRLRQIA